VSVAVELEQGQPGLRLVEERPGPARLEPVVLEAGAEAANIDVEVLGQAVDMALAGGPDEVARGWRREALCRGEDPDVFFPSQGGRGMRSLVDRCLDCPVQAPCLAAALAGGEREGIWGGTTGASRKRLRDVLRDAGIMGVVGEQAYLAWQEPGADREPPAPAEKRFARLQPWPHQLAAVDVVCEAIADGGACQVALATASGKTHVGLWVAERLEARRVLVLVPSLSLIAQTAEIWAEASADEAPSMLAVCSDTGELSLEATTDPFRVVEFLEEAPGPVVVFGTYQSSPVLVDAACRFDLTIGDEAHHLAGHADKHYAAVVRGEIPTDRTLYMTATPRQFRRRKADVDLVGMDDVEAFGPRVFDFPLSEAVEAGVVADYRVVVAAVERDVFERVARRLEEADVDPHLLAGAIAVVRAMGELGLTSCLSFHTRVDRARNFSALVGKVAEALAEVRPPGPGWSGFVHGGASVRIRRRLLARLADDHTWGVLANAKALGEGVDLPTLDAVAIVDPKNAEADVIQATGRALRRPGKGRKVVGTVLLPVLLNDSADPDDPLAGVDERSASIVAGVLRALRSHDSELSSRLDVTRRQLGRRPQQARPDAWALLRKTAARGLLRSRVELWVPGGATGEIAGALALQVVRESTESWEEAYGRLLSFVEEHGHARPAQSTEISFVEGASSSLGAWCSRQRTLYKRSLLSPDRVAQLAALPGWSWTPRDEGWWAQFDALADYLKHHDGAYPPQFAGSRRYQQLWQGMRVAQFINESRNGYRDNGWLTKFADRVAALEGLPGWVWNQRDAEWEESFAKLERWVAVTGHADPRNGDTVEGLDVGRWVSKQRGRARGRDGALSADRVARLRALPGWVDHTREHAWEVGFEHLCTHVDEHGEIPTHDHVSPDGYGLGRWIATQRSRYAEDKIADRDRIRRLEEIPGWVWAPWAEAWPAAYDRMVAFAEAHGSVRRLPEGKVDDFHLGGWATNQRRDYKRGQLAAERIALLERLPGWAWSVPDAKFEAALAAVKAFVEREGHCEPTTSHREGIIPLRPWITRIRRERALGQLSDERASQLDAIEGWTWDPPVTPEQERRHLWEAQFARLARWAAQNGHACPRQDVLVDGTRLGGWVNKQRAKYRRGALPADRVQRLEALPGWSWGRP
jgi:superfamily II DNA or RNA helicase